MADSTNMNEEFEKYMKDFLDAQRRKNDLQYAKDEKKANAVGLFSQGIGNSMMNHAEIERTKREIQETIDELKNYQDKLEEIKKEVKDLKDVYSGSNVSYFVKDSDFNDLDKVKEKLEDIKNIRQQILSGEKDEDKAVEDISKKYKISEDQAREILNNYDKQEEALGRINELNDERNNTNGQIVKSETDLTREQTRQIRNLKSGLSDVGQALKGMFDIAKDFTQQWVKIDGAVSKFAKTLGTSAQGMDNLRKQSINAVAKGAFGGKYNVSADELVGLQQNYESAIGRRVTITNEDQENMAAMNAVMGDKGGEFAAKLENFGLSYSDAAERAGKMFQTAGKYGLSFEKYSENFLSNIKMAQNYTFKNGLKGLESMAKKATAIKLDMGQIASFADKVSNLQGAVETGAQLQVLGGPFASFGDPLGMMNEGLLDMEGLIDRFTNMVGGLGKFDASTGEIAISAFNKQRIKAAAQAMGMDVSQVMESVQTQGKRNYVAQQIAGKGYNDVEQEMLMNTATVKDGSAKVSWVDSNGVKKEKDLAKERLTDDELKEIKQANQSESADIKDIAVMLRSIEDEVTGGKKQMENKKAQVSEKFMPWVKDKLGKLVANDGLMGIFSIGIPAITMSVKAIELMMAAGNTFSSIGGMKGGAGKAKGKGGGISGFFSKFKKGEGWNREIHQTKKGNWATSGNKGGYNGRIGTPSKAQQHFAKLGKGNAARGLGTSLGLMAGGALIAGIGFSKQKELNEARKNGESVRGGKKDNTKQTTANLLKYGGSGAALGAAIGTIIPGIGNVVGAAVGGAIGLAVGGVTSAIQAKNNKEALRQKNYLKSSGFDLQGDYDNKQMKEITKAINNGGDGTITKDEFNGLSEKTQKALLESGDASLFPALSEIAATAKSANIDSENATINATNITIENNSGKKVEQKANGGMLVGPSHRQGGMPILGSNIEVEGGEMVVNKHSSAKYRGTLEAINRDKFEKGGTVLANGGVIKPRLMETGGKVEVAPTKDTLSVPQTNNKQPQSQKLSVEPIKMDISGKITLDGGSAMGIDITDSLLKDTNFIRKITRLIEKQIVENTKGGNIVNKGLY
jgi:hypothetical protein